MFAKAKPSGKEIAENLSLINHHLISFKDDTLLSLVSLEARQTRVIAEVARSASAYSTAGNLKLKAGGRHYWDPDISKLVTPLTAYQKVGKLVNAGILKPKEEQPEKREETQTAPPTFTFPKTQIKKIPLKNKDLLQDPPGYLDNLKDWLGLGLPDQSQSMPIDALVRMKALDAKKRMLEAEIAEEERQHKIMQRISEQTEKERPARRTIAPVPKAPTAPTAPTARSRPTAGPAKFEGRARTPSPKGSIRSEPDDSEGLKMARLFPVKKMQTRK